MNRSGIVALPHERLAQIAPNYEAMRKAIAKVQSVDEITSIADSARAAQAYYRISRDVENELGASRIRARAERRLGELLKGMKERGEREKGGRGPIVESRRATQLKDLGIPKDRASRAMQLAEVPEGEFEAAMGVPLKPEPRRLLREFKESRDVTPKAAPAEKPLVPIEHTLDLWGGVRNFGELLVDGKLPPLNLWRTNLQPFQVAHLRRYIPLIVEYLSAIHQEIERESA